ncbi:hypothetical protein Pta02_79320 [Planobispora takensis]|uniref:Uncharacterized protein n=1 Tax=Planobispora takensis TaxID=1367882 RepID=A0A8J3T402_9ACTN|nr:hypothetical protein Pta02_79320 [Planobispora takensis]
MPPPIRTVGSVPITATARAQAARAAAGAPITVSSLLVEVFMFFVEEFMPLSLARRPAPPHRARGRAVSSPGGVGVRLW